ncbi:uncharacterized protein LOC126473853 [Schistocerca serialis cubense]|uniref:uncharacterized protein LOC126473853 n=1 Tax=Schistocerca serialis cubense TaxID=2023355 RepID=UPI00214F3065|nr:uncharacterized protein LOC126473853 [Schistocerca serialis cubense]
MKIPGVNTNTETPAVYPITAAPVFSVCVAVGHTVMKSASRAVCKHAHTLLRHSVFAWQPLRMNLPLDVTDQEESSNRRGDETVPRSVEQVTASSSSDERHKDVAPDGTVWIRVVLNSQGALLWNPKILFHMWQEIECKKMVC